MKFKFLMPGRMNVEGIPKKNICMKNGELYNSSGLGGCERSKFGKRTQLVFIEWVAVVEALDSAGPSPPPVPGVV